MSAECDLPAGILECTLNIDVDAEPGAGASFNTGYGFMPFGYTLIILVFGKNGPAMGIHLTKSEVVTT